MILKQQLLYNNLFYIIYGYWIGMYIKYIFNEIGHFFAWKPIIDLSEIFFKYLILLPVTLNPCSII